MASFEYYKNQVSIVQVAEALGYQFNRKAGSNPLEYKHDEHNTIVISNPKGRQRYFTRHEPENRGSVIDFVKHRLPYFNVHYYKEAEGINKVLAGFSGVPYESPHQQWWKGRNEHKKFNPAEFVIKAPVNEDLIYLSDRRGLNGDTLEAFKPYIKMVKPPARNLFDIGFPYTIPGQKGWVGMEVVNYLFKGQAKGSNRAEGLWVVDLSGKGKLNQRVFIAESAIDAMSFYQLNEAKYKLKDSVLLSSGGYITDRQIRNMLRFFPQARIHTLFDNDLSGHLYDIRVAAMHNNKELSLRKDDDRIHFILNQKKITLPVSEVCLTRIRKEMGIRPKVTVHKPSGKDFNEMLQQRFASERKPELRW